MDFTSFTRSSAFTPVFPADRLFLSYIIWGPDGADKDALADTLAAAVVCSDTEKRPCGQCRHCKKSFRKIHPDVIEVTCPPDKKEIPVDIIRGIRSDAIVMPNESDRKVYIIRDAGKMNSPAQNALLKTLEEPPRHACFILVSENPAGLLDTVRSRCAEIRVSPGEAPVNSELVAQVSEFYNCLEKGAVETAQFMYELEKLDRLSFAAFISQAKGQAVAELRQCGAGHGRFTPYYIATIIDVLDQSAKYQEFNVSTVHICGLICAVLIIAP